MTACGPEGMTPLHVAARFGRPDIAWDLLGGERVITTDDHDKFPRDYCCGPPEWMGARPFALDPVYGVMVRVADITLCAKHLDDD